MRPWAEPTDSAREQNKWAEFRIGEAFAEFSGRASRSGTFGEQRFEANRGEEEAEAHFRQDRPDSQ